MSESSAISERPGAYHVASFVLHAHPERLPDLREAMAAWPDVEEHAAQGGKVVLTIEGADTRDIADRARDLSELDGVLQLSPVYHELDSGETQPWT
ncbi:nitrate reductase [Marinihelvus fidelis]|uniref:Chaperone NapD n=1 Tax=Marinihelvus fidelis TaxID=2613842 RepID=A0A5N0T948_9GAMM|nr:chaperone NapD [Marinihelvus fidelis]KAA9131573.1 nitrate reductase [Marinihelvus fidelis]